MAFVRISMMIPMAGQESTVTDILDELVKFYRGRQGFIAAWRLTADPHANIKRVGRVSVWESEDDAHRTASEQRDLALQSQLKILVQAGSQEEYSFIGSQPS